MYVNDQQQWDLVLNRLNGLFADLSVETRLKLTELLGRYQDTKEALATAITEVDAVSVCSECGGQCCLNGKYRINVLDLLSRVVAQIPTFPDFTQKPVCPYGTNAGCSMEPGFRPSDCVLFICDVIDLKLSSQGRRHLAVLEQAMRTCILDASCLTGEQMGTPLLLWVDKKAKNQISRCKGTDNGNYS
jgi:hypothetical protein